jgi:hypothetical protein
MSTATAPLSTTLDEPIHHTILRDLKAIARKVAIVAIPMLGRENELRDWDLWGPLLLCLMLALVLSSASSEDQRGVVFSAVFVVIWLGSAFVTINAKFLGSSLSFFQTVCVMGYCIAPMCIASLLALFISLWYLKLILVVIAWIWSTYASLRFFRGSVRPEREGLVVFPLALFYFFMSWMMAVGI